MSYAITLTNGTPLISVNDGQIDQTKTDITLIGRNSSSYGIFFNENFIKMLENFANTSQPNNPLKGQLWFDTTQNRLKVYDGQNFKVSGGSLVQSSAPSGIASGDLWINSQTKQLFFNDGVQTTLAGPIYTADQGPSGFVVENITDTNGLDHTIVKLKVSDNLIGIFADAAFTPATSISGYTSSTQFIGYQSGSTLNVTQIISGTLSIGQTITGVGIIPNTKITGFLTGPGGTGVASGLTGAYSVSTSATVASATLTAIYGDIGIGFNVGTFGGISFTVPVSQASALLASDGSLKTADSFLSVSSASSTTGTLSVQNNIPLVLGSAGQIQVNLDIPTNTFQIYSKIANQNFDVNLSDGTNTSALLINASTRRAGIYTATPATTLDVNGTFRFNTITPQSSTSAGTAGQIGWDANYLYICITTGTAGNALWKRISIPGSGW
jgi:hypothetical protein